MILKIKDQKITWLFFFSIILIYIFYIFFKLNYYISIPDEINYLLNGLFLFEGIKPHYSHAPSSLITWISFFNVSIDLFFTFIANFLKGILTTDFLHNQSNFILTNHYQDLSNLRRIVFFIHILILVSIILLINNLEIYSNYKILFTLLLFSSPLFIYTVPLTLPNFTGWTFLVAAYLLTHKQKINLFLIGIIIGAASSNRLEIVLSCPFIFLYLYDQKKVAKNDFLPYLLYLSVSFIFLAPWFIGDLYANFKTLVSYFSNNFNSVIVSNFANDISFKYEKIIYLNSFLIFIFFSFNSFKNNENISSSIYLFLLNIFYLLSFLITPKPILHLGFVIILNYLTFLNLFKSYSKRLLQLFITLILSVNFFSSYFNLNLIYGEKQALSFLKNNFNNKALTIFKPQTIIELNTDKKFYEINKKFLNSEYFYKNFNSNIKPDDDNFFYTIYNTNILYNIPNTKLTYGIYRRYFFVNENINKLIKNNTFNIKILGNNQYLNQINKSKLYEPGILYTININKNNYQYPNLELLFKKGNVEIYNICENLC